MYCEDSLASFAWRGRRHPTRPALLQRGSRCSKANAVQSKRGADCPCCEADSPSQREFLDQRQAKTVPGFPAFQWNTPAPMQRRRKKPNKLPRPETNTEADGHESAATKRHVFSEANRKKQKEERKFRTVEKLQLSARFAAAHAYKGRIFMIACTLASFYFFFGLFVGHSSIDALEDLAFRQTGVFEPRNFGAGHDRQAIQMALQNELDCRLRKTDQLEGNSVHAHGIKLVRVSDIENLLLSKSGASQIRSGFGA